MAGVTSIVGTPVTAKDYHLFNIFPILKGFQEDNKKTSSIKVFLKREKLMERKIVGQLR